MSVNGSEIGPLKQAHFDQAIRELLFEGGELTRRLLGFSAVS